MFNVVVSTSPSTSTLALISKLPLKVEIPETSRVSVSVSPMTLIPVLVVANFSEALWYNSTSAFALVTIA